MTQVIDTEKVGGKYEMITNEVKENRTWFMVLGVIMILLGIAAIAFPFIATLAMDFFVGGVLVIGGIGGIVNAFRVAKWKGFLLFMLTALLALGVGIFLLLFPFSGILSLTLLVTVFLIIDGVLRIFLAFRLRPYDQWKWQLFGGMLGLVLAGIILAQWPEAATWIIGLLVGVNLVFSGWTLIMLAVTARRAA